MKTFTEVKEELILERLKQFNQNRTQAAISLGVSIRYLRHTLQKMKERGVDVEKSPRDYRPFKSSSFLA